MQSPDFGRICRLIGSACGEASVGCRQSAKRAMWRMVDQLGQQQVEVEMRRALTSAQMAVVCKCLERGEERGSDDTRSVSFAASGGGGAGKRDKSHTRGAAGRSSHSSVGSSAEGSTDLSTAAALSINGSSAFDYGRSELDPSLERTTSLSPHTPHSSSSMSSLSSASLSSTASFSPSPCKTSILKRRSTLSSSASSASSNASSRQSTRTSASMPASSSSAYATASGSDVAPSDALSAINGDLSATDWRTRLHAIATFCTFVHSYPSFASSHVSTFLDALLNVVADNNGKVIIAALQSLPAVLPSLLASMPLLPFLQQLCGNLSSTSPTVRSLTSQLLDDMPAWMDGGGGSLLAGYSGVCLYGNSKIRVLMLEKLTELIARKGLPAGAKLTGKSRGLGVQQLKHAIPVAFLWCDEGRADMRSLLQKLTLLLYGSLGSEMFDAQLLLSLKVDQE